MKSKKSFFRTVEPYLYLVPVMILFILFVFWPFVKTIRLSFARTTPLGQVAQYVGLDNYTNIFTDASGYFAQYTIVGRIEYNSFWV